VKNKKIIFVSILSAMFIFGAMIIGPSSSLAMTPSKRITSSANVVQEMSAQEDVDTMAYLVKKSYGVVIIPSFRRQLLV
jgi:hypothetical protein